MTSCRKIVPIGIPEFTESIKVDFIEEGVTNQGMRLKNSKMAALLYLFIFQKCDHSAAEHE